MWYFVILLEHNVNMAVIGHLHQSSLNTRRAWLVPQITWQSEDVIG